jgi:Hypoxia induced protein conserved region
VNVIAGVLKQPGAVPLDWLVALLLAMTTIPGFAFAQAGLQGSMAIFMSHIAVPIAIGAVAIVLLLGLANMMRGGSGNTSQKLMRLRVLLQFVAIIVIMITLWVMGK